MLGGGVTFAELWDSLSKENSGGEPLQAREKVLGLLRARRL